MGNLHATDGDGGGTTSVAATRIMMDKHAVRGNTCVGQAGAVPPWRLRRVSRIDCNSPDGGGSGGGNEGRGRDSAMFDVMRLGLGGKFSLMKTDPGASGTPTMGATG